MSRTRLRRGFTLIELMLVVVIIGILSTFAIPQFLRAAARAQRSEMQTVMDKMRVYFINVYRSNGRYTVPPGGVEQNPGVLGPVVGQSATWNTGCTSPSCKGWEDYTFAPTGGLKMRYTYSTDGHTLTLTATGQFPGMDGRYTFSEFYLADSLASTTEFPPF